MQEISQYLDRSHLDGIQQLSGIKYCKKKHDVVCWWCSLTDPCYDTFQKVICYSDEAEI